MEQSPTSQLSSPRTLFADFPDVALGRVFIDQLKQQGIAIAVYSINAPTTTGGCRVAVQVEGAEIERATKIVTDMKGTTGPVKTPKRTETKQTNEPADEKNSEGDSGEMPAKKKTTAKKATSKKTASPRFAKKTACAAPGHGEYGDIESHNKKHHAGKAFVAKAK